MTDLIATPGQTLSLLRVKTMTSTGPELTGEIKIALIPDERLDAIKSEIAERVADLKEFKKVQRSLMTQGEICRKSAVCEECSLCPVCAGKHYSYSRDFDKHWPPGQEKCFGFLMKSGAALQPEPCKLCEEHDKLRRDTIRSVAQAQSEGAKLTHALSNSYAKRDALFAEFAVEIAEFQE